MSKHPPLDPAAVARVQQVVQRTAPKRSRSRLVDLEAALLELRAKHCTYEHIQNLLDQQIGWRPAISTLHDFVKAAKKRRAKARPVVAAQSEAVAPPSLDRPSAHPKMPAEKTSLGARIQSLKARAAHSDAGPNAELFKFDPTQPLLPDSTKKTQI